MRPHCTLRRFLVHPKDKKSMEETSGIVYKIPCNSCSQTYIGETGRLFRYRRGEHQSEAEEVTDKHYTRSQRKVSESTLNKSAITDHMSQNNHIMNWEGSKILSREDNTFRRGVREAIHIWKDRQTVMNRDQGRYKLSKVFNPILSPGVKRQKSNSTHQMSSTRSNQSI